MADLVPPQNIEAEEAVIGAILLNNRVIPELAETLRPEHFYRDSHATIFRTALMLEADGKPVDIITVTEALSAKGLLEHAGGTSRVREIAALVPTASNAPHYAAIVRDAAILRGIIRAGGDIAELGWRGEGEPSDLLAKAETILGKATDTLDAGDFSPFSEGIDELFDELKEAVDAGKPLTGLQTGFYDLDKVTTGFYPGQVIVVAARPGVGKSVLAQNITENVVAQGKKAAFFTLEMSRKELQQRSLCRHTKIPLQRIRTARLDHSELSEIHRTLESIRHAPLYVEDNPSLTIPELRARARRLQKRAGLDLLVVDYLQLMLSARSTESRQQEVALISRSLKLLAKELKLPVIAVSQLNRNLDSREDKRPTLSDLRDSGAIEQDADVVLFIYREELHKKVEADKARNAELIVAKNRMGESDTTCRLLFMGHRQLFATPAREAA